MYTDFGDDSSSRFPFRARTNRQMQLKPYLTPAAIQAASIS